MKIDTGGDVPIFRQIAEQLRKQIENGVHRPGEALPSLRAMALKLRVNPNTVQRAYELLEREGVVQSRRGVGIFVRQIDPRDGRVEERLCEKLRPLVQRSLKQGLAPDRIRTLFDVVLRESLAEVDA
ncbi:MAG: GntR family transcriptional regulator [Planctomycetota bacterium]